MGRRSARGRNVPRPCPSWDMLDFVHGLQHTQMQVEGQSEQDTHVRMLRTVRAMSELHGLHVRTGAVAFVRVPAKGCCSLSGQDMGLED